MGLAAALALSGCPEQPPPPPAPVYGAPPGADVAPPPPAPVDSAQAAPDLTDTAPEPSPDDERPAARYGAPPRDLPPWAPGPGGGGG